MLKGLTPLGVLSDVSLASCPRCLQLLLWRKEREKRVLNCLWLGKDIFKNNFKKFVLSLKRVWRSSAVGMYLTLLKGST